MLDVDRRLSRVPLPYIFYIVRSLFVIFQSFILTLSLVSCSYPFLFYDGFYPLY